MVRMNYHRSATALRSCLWHWRFIVPLSQRVSSQVQSMTWFHNSQLRDWVHGCVTAAITQVSPGPSLVLSPSTIAPAPPSKILAAAAAISAVESQSRHTTRVVVDKAKVTIEVRISPFQYDVFALISSYQVNYLLSICCCVEFV
jgi:hypothetical protein